MTTNKETLMSLLDVIEELATLVKAQGSTLRVLCLGRDWKAVVEDYEQQVRPQIHQSLHPMRQTISELLDSEYSEFPHDWEAGVKRTLDSI